MQTMELMERRPQTAECMEPSPRDLDRRIETIMHVKALGEELSPTRERHFRKMVRLARDGAASPKSTTRIAASSILDVLGLELCDE